MFLNLQTVIAIQKFANIQFEMSYHYSFLDNMANYQSTGIMCAQAKPTKKALIWELDDIYDKCNNYLKEPDFQLDKRNFNFIIEIRSGYVKEDFSQIGRRNYQAAG